MSDTKKEEEPNKSDDENKIPKSSNTNDNESKKTPIKDDKREKCEEFNLEDKNKVGKSSSKTDIENEKTSNADSAVANSKDSNPPVSVCFKETSEVVSKESYVSMLEDINLFFSNLKELESKRTSKRKFKSVSEDLSEKADPSQSEECVQPSKKLLLDTSTKKVISSQQSQILSKTSESHQSVAEVSTASPVNADPLLLNVASEAIKCNDLSAESNTSPPTCQAGTSSEVSSSTADQPIGLQIEAINVPDNPREVENQQLPPREIINSPVQPLVIEYYDQQFAQLNGVRPHRFPGTLDVQIFIPLFEHLLNDLLELRSFLDGQPVQPSEEATSGTSLELTLLDRQLVAISEEFGTGVESLTAQTTREALSEFGINYNRRVGSETPSEYSDDPEVQSDHTEDSSSGSSTHRIESESSSNELPDKISNQPLSQEPIQSCSKSDETMLATKSPQSNPETGPLGTGILGESSTTANPVQCIESESSSGNILENTTNASTDQIPINVVALPTDSLRFNLAVLRALNAEGRRCIAKCVETSKSVLSICLLHGINSFHETFVKLIQGMLDMLRRLVLLRQECSEMLKRCPDKNSDAGIAYVLRVKIHVAKIYNKVLEDILKLNSNFHEEVKDKLPPGSID